MIPVNSGDIILYSAVKKKQCLYDNLIIKLKTMNNEFYKYIKTHEIDFNILENKKKNNTDTIYKINPNTKSNAYAYSNIYIIYRFSNHIIVNYFNINKTTSTLLYDKHNKNYNQTFYEEINYININFITKFRYTYNNEYTFSIFTNESDIKYILSKIKKLYFIFKKICKINKTINKYKILDVDLDF